MPAGGGVRVAEEMTRAFDLNLFMLSVLALLVGGFLIYNTMAFSVVQRREAFGILRALGATRAEIFAAVLSEAVLLAFVGAVIGLAMGQLLGYRLLGLVTTTLNDHYLVVTGATLNVSYLTYVKGVALGIGVGAIAAMVPAWEATQATPRAAAQRSILESKVGMGSASAAKWGAILIGVAVIACMIPAGGAEAGFMSLFALVAGGSLCAAAATRSLLALLSPLAVRLGGRLGRVRPQKCPGHLVPDRGRGGGPDGGARDYGRNGGYGGQLSALGDDLAGDDAAGRPLSRGCPVAPRSAAFPQVWSIRSAGFPGWRI